MQYYGPLIIQSSGFINESKNALLYSMIFIALVMVVGNFVGMTLSRKYGRRQLILMCTMPMALSMLTLCLVVSYEAF